MATLSGIKTLTDAKGNERYLRIDLKKHGENKLLQDFIDIAIIEERKNEPTKKLEDVLKRLDKKNGLK